MRDGSQVMRIVVVPGVVMRMLMFVMISVCCYDVSMLFSVPPIMFVAQRINRMSEDQRTYRNKATKLTQLDPKNNAYFTWNTMYCNVQSLFN